MYDRHLYNSEIITTLKDEYNVTMSLPTLYRYKQQIQLEDSEIWDKIGFDSAKYRAVRLLASLEEGASFSRKVRDDPNASYKDRIEASKNVSVFETSIYRLVKDGPDFKQLPLVKTHVLSNNNQALTNTKHDLSKATPTQTPTNTTTNDVITTNQVDNTTTNEE